MNKTLLAGIMITSMMVLIAMIGPLIAPYGPYDQLKIEYVLDENGEGTVIAPPAPPGQQYLLGTDKSGYDMLTKLLHGAKYTIFLSIGIAFARVAIGGGIGMLLGFYSKSVAQRSTAASPGNLLNGIPVFIIIWLMMIGITINPVFSPLLMSLLLGAVLTIVGVPAIMSTVKEKTLVLRERQFVTASQSLGAGGGGIIRKHLLPHLKESFLILIVQEIILVLTLFGQLALFQIFVGGTIKYYSPSEFHSRTNEWGGLIGQARGNFQVYEWIFYSPLVAYVLLIVGFHLLSKGLEKRYNQLYARFPHF
ncbi:ABC transporter permease [Paenibacillus sp. strain BS8-2]